MARTKISEFSATPGNNTDIDGINIAEGCAPSGINDAIRELMSQLKDFQAGTAGDSFNGPVGTTTAAAGAFTTLSASSTVSGTGFSNYLASPPAIGGTAAAAGSFTTLSASSTVTLSGGTANGVLYLNGSKVLTTGSALTFDGTNLGVGVTPGVSVDVGGAIRSKISGGSPIYYFNDATYQLDIKQSGNALVFDLNGGSEQARLTSTGLGIGTSSPGAKLDVAGNANIKQFVSAGNGVTDGYLGYSWNRNLATGALFDNAKYAYDLLMEPGSNNLFLEIYAPGSIPVTGTALVVTPAGNLGLGVEPSAWSGFRALQVGGATSIWSTTSGGGSSFYSNNVYYDGTNRKRINAGYAAEYIQDSTSGGHNWYTAGTSTAGSTISFTQAMTLDGSGNLVLGNTSASALLDINGGTVTSSSAPAARFVRNNGGSAYSNLSGLQIYWNHSNGSQENNIVYGGASTSFLNFVQNNAGTFTETARITSGGDLLVGQTSAGLADADSITLSKQYGVVYVNHLTGQASGAQYAIFGYAGGSIGSITQNGTTGVLYNITSDYRLKNVVGAVTGSGARIDSLLPVDYTWKDDGSASRGFLAHEFQAVYPNSVTGTKDAVDAEGKPVYQQMQASTTEVIADLVAEIQSLRARVAQLEAK